MYQIYASSVLRCVDCMVVKDLHIMNKIIHIFNAGEALF